MSSHHVDLVGVFLCLSFSAPAQQASSIGGQIRANVKANTIGSCSLIFSYPSSDFLTIPVVAKVSQTTRLSGISTLYEVQVAGLHRAGPSATLDKHIEF